MLLTSISRIFSGFILAFTLPMLSARAEGEPVPAVGGTLEVTTDAPGADVMLDGNRAGITPVKVENIAAGPHEILVTRPGSLPVTRTVQVVSGALTIADVTLSAVPAAAAAPVQDAPAASAKSQALKEFGLSVADMPWAGLTVGVTFGFLLAAVIFFTTTPTDLPFFSDNNLNIPTNAWRIAGAASAAAALATGSVALVLLAVRLTPFGKLMNVFEAMSTNDDKNKQAAH